ncbi:uncharacterized protein LOC127988145 isoform X2 [Carassius gibelio]|uniref:uncharacterized protein LOC127988145 isoform X2 n=1 Tax=Carassius gibelio TaxID=101364 RepID=UPI00227908C0|nr:uncharacterized protein LOC127988145 isoform X2 [Carassius gibelio]
MRINVLLLSVLLFKGVFGASDEMKSVMEGDSVTLHAHLTEMQKADLILWKYGPDRDHIAQLNTLDNRISLYPLDGRFRNRLQLDDQTGSLTIIDIRNEHAGVYELHIIGGNEVPPKRFTIIVSGVFGETVSVTEGDSVTLNVTEIHEDDDILWNVVAEHTRIAEINRDPTIFYTYNGPDERFRDRLKLDRQTGSLTITNITTQHAGEYEVKISGAKLSSKTFSVSVYAHLPVPVISRNSSQCSSSSSSSSYCSLLCSVVNVGHVTLSWYKGNSLLSSISVSDLSISLSLPLEVEYQEKNSYSCVINNPIRNQTTHLDISKLCHTCSALDLTTVLVLAFSLAVVVAIFFGVFCYFHHRKTKQAADKGSGYFCTGLDGEEHIGLTNGTLNEKDEIKSLLAMVGERVTLHTDLTEIQDDELIRWKFADFKVNKLAEFSVIAKWDKTKNEEYLYNEERFKDSLHLDHNTGSLTITNITPKHYGHYKLHIGEGQKITKTFNLLAHVPKKRQSRTMRRKTIPL